MRVLRLIAIALFVSVALSGCLTLESYSGVGPPTWRPVSESEPGFLRLDNPYYYFSCVGDGLFDIGFYGECDAHYQGEGIVVPIPSACIQVLETFHPFHQAGPPGDPGPIDVALVEPGTGHVLAEIPDATTWMGIYPAGFQAHYILAPSVIFTVSGPGTLTRGNMGAGQIPQVINTPHVAAQPEYIARVTCASKYDATTGTIERHTQTGVLTPS